MSDHDTDPGAEDTTQPLSLGEVQSPRAPDPRATPAPEQLDAADEQPEQPEQVASGPTGPPPSTPPPATPATPVGPSWTPPSGPLPAAPSQPWHDYARGTQAFPVAASSHVADRSRPSGWIWPVVVAVALVVGVIGGVGGAIAYQQADDDEPVSSYGGLDDEEIVELPPVDAGGVTAVAEALLPSTVQIAAELDGTPGGATGSGFVIDPSGHIITNNHVIESAASNDGLVEVVDQDGNTYEVEIVGRSPVYDIAVLALPEDADLEPAALGSSEQLRVGDGVVAIGSPARPQLDRDRRHRQRAAAPGHHRLAGRRLLLHQRRADRRRDQPRQLGRAAGQPARPGRRRQLRHRHERRRHHRRRGRQHRRRVRDPGRAGARSPPTRSSRPARPATP